MWGHAPTRLCEQKGQTGKCEQRALGSHTFGNRGRWESVALSGRSGPHTCVNKRRQRARTNPRNVPIAAIPLVPNPAASGTVSQVSGEEVEPPRVVTVSVAHAVELGETARVCCVALGGRAMGGRGEESTI